MGWCSATDIFDTVIRSLEEDAGVQEETKKKVARTLYDSLTANDWDCESDSDYYVKYILDIELEEGVITQSEYDEYKELYS